MIINTEFLLLPVSEVSKLSFFMFFGFFHNLPLSAVYQKVHNHSHLSIQLYFPLYFSLLCLKKHIILNMLKISRKITEDETLVCSLVLLLWPFLTYLMLLFHSIDSCLLVRHSRKPGFLISIHLFRRIEHFISETRESYQRELKFYKVPPE